MTGMKFHHVETGIPSPPGRLSELLHQALNLARGQFPWGFLIRRQRNRRSRHRLVPLDLSALSAQVHQLDTHQGPFGVHQIGQLPQRRNESVFVDSQLNGRRHAYVNNPRGQNYESNAAPGPGGIEVLHPVARHPVHGQSVYHGGHDDPVLQLDPSHLHRREEQLKILFGRFPFRNAAVNAP